MSVKLIWSTPSGEELVAYMARVSNSDNQDIYTHDVLTADRLVYTNWKLKNKDEEDIEE